MSDPLANELAALRVEWGLQFRPVSALLDALSAQPRTPEQLVRVSGLSHRSVTGILQRLGPWLEGSHGGYRLSGAVEPDRPADVNERDLQAVVSRLVERAPAPKRRLDHVAATPYTAVHRAAFLASRYWLDGARVLFMGDHDLTALALALRRPGARLTVVDVDEDLLEYIDGVASELDVQIDCWFADLRLGLPPGLRGAADVVFTDPPYTPEGVGLFAARAVQALRRHQNSRLLLCYGHSELEPRAGLKVQTVLHRLRLLLEEIRPQFNRYQGAEAIGSASSLYVAQPTAETWKSVEADPLDSGMIYSHGPMAVEAAAAALPADLVGEVADLMPVAELWRLSERHAAARPERRPVVPEVAAADLRQLPTLAPHLLLVSRLRRLQLVLPAAYARTVLDREWCGGLFAPSYEFRQLASGGGASVVGADRRTTPAGGADALARHVVDHPRASLGASLREALIEAGLASTKNEARQLLAMHPTLVRHQLARAADLPGHVLSRVAELLHRVGE